MDLIFQGFQSSLPAWVYLLIFVATCLLAWWSYKGITGIRTSYRYILVALRSAAFFILLLLLLNPLFQTETPYFQKPNITVLLDNSASTAIEKSAYKGIKSYKEVLNQLNFGDSSAVNFNFLSIGNETEPTRPEKLSFDADQTNLSSAVQNLKGNQSETSAVLLISDGIYTKGQNPVFEAQDLKSPIFAIGLGDTTFQKDVLVSSVTTNSTGYLNSKQPVTATITSKDFAGESFQVELRKGEETIRSKTVTPKISNSTQEVTFELPLKEKGLQQYKIRIPELADEWSGANNIQRFSIDVRDARQQILSLAFEVYPDVKFVRSLLETDKNTNLINRTWLRGDRFVEGNFALDPDTVDLAIIHGYPRSGLSGKLLQQVKELAQTVPLIIAASPLFDPQQFERQITSLPVSVTGPWNFVSVSLNPEVESTAHPIMELPASTYERLPQLSAPIQNLENTPGGTKLFSSKFQGNDTQKPVVVVQELGNKRQSLITGFGWFRLNINSNPEIREFARQLWFNTISWTATDPENQLLEVHPAQTSFNGSENVAINAYLNNERGEVESGATIDISVSADSMDTRFYSMENKGSGQYRLDLGKMPEGLYSFEATAKKGDRTIESKKGEFAVARSNDEFLNPTQNTQLLRQIAERTGGAYTPYDSVEGFWSTLDRQGLLDHRKKIQTTFFYPYRHFAWFILVLLLLAGEWIFRKYLSLP